ncbi:MAG: SUMF1/EgtB/PvdO family nonheme iron enzyme, partial [Treponema sp.]|nr:SUMF1/EgtB/PvdO family nonheme iron enzyme [Treponema sp.]
AIEYCNRRSLEEGYTPCYTDGFEYDICADGYRLPTETEWEFAARGGKISNGFTYSGSDDVESVAWYMNNSGNKPHQVMSKEANELGIYDMSGNVAEWCWDWYGNYPSNREDIDPTGPSSGERRIHRGGSYGYSIDNCSGTFSNCDSPDYTGLGVGFRVVRSGPRG